MGRTHISHITDDWRALYGPTLKDALHFTSCVKSLMPSLDLLPVQVTPLSIWFCCPVQAIFRLAAVVCPNQNITRHIRCRHHTLAICRTEHLSYSLALSQTNGIYTRGKDATFMKPMLRLSAWGEIMGPNTANSRLSQLCLTRREACKVWCVSPHLRSGPMQKVSQEVLQNSSEPHQSLDR